MTIKPSPVRRQNPATAPSPNYRLQIEYLPIGVPQIHPDNVRTHNKRNLIAIQDSLRVNGQTKPIVLSGLPGCNYVLAGNGTLEAARLIGWREIACVRVQGLSESEELAYIIADNQTTDLSEFEWNKLTEVFRKIESDGINLDTTGFQEFERRPLMEAAWHPGEVHDRVENTLKRIMVQFSKKQWERVKAGMDKAREEYPKLERATDAVIFLYMAEMYVKLPFNPPYSVGEEDL